MEGPARKYRLDPGDPVTTDVVAERLARRILNTVDPTLPGHLARAQCVEAVRDLPALLRDLVGESLGRADLVERRHAERCSRRTDPVSSATESAPDFAAHLPDVRLGTRFAARPTKQLRSLP